MNVDNAGAVVAPGEPSGSLDVAICAQGEIDDEWADKVPVVFGPAPLAASEVTVPLPGTTTGADSARSQRVLRARRSGSRSGAGGGLGAGGGRRQRLPLAPGARRLFRVQSLQI